MVLQAAYRKTHLQKFLKHQGFRNLAGFLRQRDICGLKSIRNSCPISHYWEAMIGKLFLSCGGGAARKGVWEPGRHRWVCEGYRCGWPQGAKVHFKTIFKKEKKGFWWWQLATDEGWQEDWCVFRLCQEITLLGYVTEHIRATHQSSPYVSSRKLLPDKVLG